MMDEIISSINNQQITKNMSNCKRCGLPIHVCICDHIKRLRENTKTDIFIDIIFHKNELLRNTNTGRLVEFIFPHKVKGYVWERKIPPSSLIEDMKDPNKKYFLLYPEQEEIHIETKEDNMDSNKEIHIVVLDGTWQEAAKILKKSPYLQTMEKLIIKSDRQSQFQLRRNQKTGNLCTSEAIAEALHTVGATNAATALDEITSLFLENYEKGRYGHGL